MCQLLVASSGSPSATAPTSVSPRPLHGTRSTSGGSHAFSRNRASSGAPRTSLHAAQESTPHIDRSTFSTRGERSAADPSGAASDANSRHAAALAPSLRRRVGGDDDLVGL